MLTKGAIGNLVNRYRAVLTKCNLINTFGSLAVASMLVLGGAGMAEAEEFQLTNYWNYVIGQNGEIKSVQHGGENSPYVTYDIPENVDQIKLDAAQKVITFEKNASLHAADIEIISSQTIMDSTNRISGDRIKIHSIQQSADSAQKGGTVSASERIDFTGYCALTDMTISAPIITNSSWALDLRGNTVIDAEHLILRQTSSVSDNASFSSKLSKVTLQDKARIQLMGANSLKFDTLVVDNENGDEANLVDRMPNSSKETIAFDIGNVELSEGSTLTVYATDKKEGGIVKFDNVDLKSGSELRLGWRNSDYEGTLTQKNIGTLTLAEGAKVVAADKAWDSENEKPDDTIKGQGSANIENIIFEGKGAEVNATVVGDSTNVTVKDGVEDASITKIAATKATVTVENPNNSTMNIGEVAEDTSVNVTTGKENNTGNLDALAESVNIAKNNGTVTASIDENDIYGALSGTINEDGSVSNFKQDKNSLMDAALQQASVTMVSLDKILTNDVRKRLGDIRSDANTTGMWMRWDGGKMKGDSGLTNNFNTIQIGGDTKAAKNCRIGFAGSFTHGDTEFSRGNGELEGFSFALYGTWMGENGMFADVVARLGKFSTEMNVEGRKGDMDNRVASLSGEYGWRFNLAQQFFVEPQVELAYTYVSSDDLQLGTTKFAFDSVDSLTGRAGVVAGWNLPEERGNVYARASVLQQFMGDAKISGSNGNAHNIQEIDGEDTWLEYGIGANVKLTDSTYLWADVERTEGADIEEEWRGTVGIRYSF